MNIQIGENSFKSINRNVSGEETLSPTYTKDMLRKNIKEEGVEDLRKNQAASFIKSNGLNKPVIDNMNPDQEKKPEMKIADIPDSKLMKDYMTVMSNSMSSGDFNNLSKEGFNPKDMDVKELVTVTDRIKARMAMSGSVVSGYNDDLNSAALEEYTGSEEYAKALAKSYTANDVPVNKENLEAGEAAVNMAMSIPDSREAALNLLSAGETDFTIENLFNLGSGNSGSFGENNVDTNELRKVLMNNGIEVTDESLSLAGDLVNRDIPLNPENFDEYKEMLEVKFPFDTEYVAERIAEAVKDGKRPEKAVLNKEGSLLDRAVALNSKLKDIRDDSILRVVNRGAELNLKNIIRANEEEAENLIPESDKEIRAVRLLQETRLTMTVSSTYFLMKNDINVETRDLSLLVDDLREAENRQFEALYGKKTEAENRISNEIFEETLSKVNEIKNMPLMCFGIYSSKSAYSLNTVYEEVKSISVKLNIAEKAYETMGTEVRRDLGDSIRGAFRNIPELLEEAGLPDSEENKRAARILGYNSMEISTQNVENVKKTVEKIENVINKMTPAATLSLIRKGINPLTESLDNVEKNLNSVNRVENEPERFSQYLVNLEKHNGITEEERESYIGIYRLINSIEKNDMAAAGALLNERAEINFKNLLSAVRSEKRKGFDVKLGENITNVEKVIEDITNIRESIEAAYNSRNNAMSYENEELSYIRESLKGGDRFVETLLNNNIPVTVSDINGLKDIVKNRGGAFKSIKKELSKDTVKMGDFDTVIKNIPETFNDEESAVSAFEDMGERLKELINERTPEMSDLSDLKAMKFALNQIFTITKLSKEQCFEVPVTIDDTISTVSVKIRKGQTKNVEISFENEALGKVRGYFSKAENGLKGFFNSSGSDLSDLLDSLREEFSKRDLPVSELEFVNSDRIDTNVFRENTDNFNRDEKSNGMDEDGTDAISTRTFYQVAKSFIEVLIRR